MSTIYNPLDISIRKSQNDLFTEIVGLRRDNAFITKLLNRYSDYVQQLCVAHEKANQTRSLSHDEIIQLRNTINDDSLKTTPLLSF